MMWLTATTVHLPESHWFDWHSSPCVQAVPSGRPAAHTPWMHDCRSAQFCSLHACPAVGTAAHALFAHTVPGTHCVSTVQAAPAAPVPTTTFTNSPTKPRTSTRAVQLATSALAPSSARCAAAES